MLDPGDRGARWRRVLRLCFHEFAMRRFVVLHHELPPHAQRPSHFDLMIEADGALWTWSMPQWPEPGVPLNVEPLPDHRLTYLEYEGPVSGDRGHVTRRESGTCELLCRDEARTVVRVNGTKLRGTLEIDAVPSGCRLVWQPEEDRLP